MRDEDVIELIFLELELAERKHPGWPDDKIHAVAIMAEESGEAVKAAIDATFSNGSIADLKRELAQTGAMCIRALKHL